MFHYPVCSVFKSAQTNYCFSRRHTRPLSWTQFLGAEITVTASTSVYDSLLYHAIVIINPYYGLIQPDNSYVLGPSMRYL